MARPHFPQRPVRSSILFHWYQCWSWRERCRFKELATRVVPGERRAKRRGLRQLSARLESLRTEFAGSTELCYLHAESIVRIRRGLKLANSLSRFCAMWRYERDHLASTLNSRWLISALDTFADHGTPVQKAVALMLSSFFNALRFAETERRYLDNSGDLASVDPAQKFELWDGIQSFNIRTGDTMVNMFDRMRQCVANDPALNVIFQELLKRTLDAENPLARISRINIEVNKV